MVTRTNQVQDQDKASKRLSLVADLSKRAYGTDVDSRIYNMYVEIEKDINTKESRFTLIKRPGCALHGTVDATPAGDIRGVIWFIDKFYSVYGTQVWTYSGAGPGVLLYTLATSTGPVGFADYDNGTNRYLIMCDGTNAYYIANGSPPTVTQITDAQFPSSPIPMPVVMDGYVFIAKQGTGDIYNSDLNTPSSWSSQLIRTELYPDNVKAIKKHLNQLVAFGESSIEFFYDAGNTSSSPLSRTEGTSYQMGTCAPYAIVGTERYLIFPSQATAGGRAVHMFDGFQLKKISNNYVEKFLDALGALASQSVAYTLRSNGHLFYVLKAYSQTFVYDIDTEYWSIWSLNNEGAHQPYLFSHVADDNNGVAYGFASTGLIYSISTDYFKDGGTSILCEVYTNPYDAESWSRKFCHGVYLISDKLPANTYTNTNVTLKWSDDDYQTWSVGRILDLVKRAFTPRLGHFRRRAFWLQSTSDGPLRFEALEFTDMQTGHN